MEEFKQFKPFKLFVLRRASHRSRVETTLH